MRTRDILFIMAIGIAAGALAVVLPSRVAASFMAGWASDTFNVLPNVSGYKSWDKINICQQDPDTLECAFKVTERGDVIIPYGSSFIVNSGPGLTTPSGAHFLARDCAFLGPCQALEAASVRGTAIIHNHATDTVDKQRNLLECPNPVQDAEGCYFPYNNGFGRHYGQAGVPQSAVHVQSGYLQLPVVGSLPPEDCNEPEEKGRLALFTGEVGVRIIACGDGGWEW